MANDPDGNVTLTVHSADGTTLHTARTADEWFAQQDGQERVSKDTVTGVIPFVLPYPEETAEIVIEREGTTTTVMPLAWILDDAMTRVVEESFEGNFFERRTALADQLSAVAEEIRNGSYRSARNKLRTDIRDTIQQWLREGGAVPANFYTKSELLALIDDAIDRLEILEETADD